MWWKLYFWLMAAFAALGVLSFAILPEEITPVVIGEIVLFAIAVTGLYSYVYAKQFVPSLFWLIFFVVYVLFDVLSFTVVLFPELPYANELAAILELDVEITVIVIIGFLLDIPLLYALYKLGRKQPRVKTENHPIMVANNTAPKWGMVQTAFWGYNTVFTGILFALSLVPVQSSEGGGSADVISGAILFGPLILFWTLIIMQYKKYKWNWWKTTLAANSILYSGIILYGLLLPTDLPTEQAGFDIIGTLQIGILFLSLVIFGRDQFKPNVV